MLGAFPEIAWQATHFENRLRRDVEKGLRKGTKQKKQHGADTLHKIKQLIIEIGVDPTERGTAAKLARRLGLDRSTVWRHLRTINKEK